MDYGATEIVFEVPETVRINDLFNDPVTQTVPALILTNTL